MKKKNVHRLVASAGILVALYYYVKWNQKNIDALNQLAEKNQSLYQLMEQWVLAKQEGKDFSEYFRRHNYKTVAIYGMGIVGRRLAKELDVLDIKEIYGIDRNAKDLFSNIKILTLDDNLPKVDIVVVTIVNEYDKIKKELVKKGQKSVVSLEDLLFDVINM